MPESSNGSKLTPVIVGWILKVLTLLIVGIATLSYTSITKQLDDQQVILTELGQLMLAAKWTDSLQGLDIIELEENMVTHLGDAVKHR